MKDIADIVREQTALYRHYDAEGKLLYVGVSLSPAARTYQHSKSAHWFRDISRIDVEWHDDREKAMCAERLAIRKENPAYNICLNNVCSPDVSKRNWGIIPVLRNVSISEWLSIQGLKAEYLATAVGAHKAQVYRWASGHSKPRVDVAFRIEDATGGAVPARAWVE